MKIANESQLLAGIDTTLPSARCILAFAPHPDDEVFGCGGLLALLQAAGTKVQVHILTDGALGGDRGDDSLVARREAESCAAAAILGIPAPHFWRLPDRGLIYGEPLVCRLQEAIAAAGADLILLPAVTELHPDHQALALAGAEAVRRLGGERQAAYYEIGNALAAPNLLVDISEVVERKRQAMAAFVSQLALQPYAERISGLNRYRAHLLAGEAHSAEAFLVTTARELASGLQRLFDGNVAYRRHLGYAADPADLPLVSVIVRSMDRDSLDRALDSIACQTYPHIEVVVVNAKGAGHRPLESTCGHFPLRVVGDDGPLARSRAANVGLDNAKGDCLIFLDDDDRFYPEHIHALVESLSEDDDLIAAYSAARLVGVDGREIEVLGEDFDLIQLYLQNYIPIHALMFREKAVTSGARFDETIDVCEDWDFWLNISQYGKMKYNNYVGVDYFIDNEKGSQVRIDQDKTRNETIRIYKKWMKCWDNMAVIEITAYARTRKLINKYANTLAEAGFSGRCFEDYLKDASKIKLLYDNVRHEISEAQKQRDIFINECHNMQQSNQAIIEENHNLQQVNRDLHQNLSGVLSEVEAVRQEYAAVVSSNSWKLTYPLRRLGEYIRHLKKST